MIVKNLGGVLPDGGEAAEDRQLLDQVRKAANEQVPEAFDRFAFSVGIDAWLKAVFACNAYVDTRAPWALKKTDPERMQTVLATLYICIAVLAVGIRPVIPASADRLLDSMGVAKELRAFEAILGHWYSPLAESEFRLDRPTPLFPRLELEEEPEAAA
jgi:methionyl-tRNA synthetase